MEKFVYFMTQGWNSQILCPWVGLLDYPPVYISPVPHEHDRCSSAKFSGHVSHPCFICFATRCLLALLTDISGGRIRMTKTRLIVGLITPYRTYLTITKTCKGRPRPDPGCSATDDDDISPVPIACGKVGWIRR
jgi:hypothetical protein